MRDVETGEWGLRRMGGSSKREPEPAKELRGWLEGLLNPDGSVGDDVRRWLKWTCAARPDAGATDPEQMQIDAPQLRNPVQTFCME